MEDLVIFTSLPMCIILGAIVLLHLLSTFVTVLLPQLEKKIQMIAVWGISIVNVALHFILIGYSFIKGAKPEEMLLVIMISAAVAMTAIGIREKISKGKK